MRTPFRWSKEGLALTEKAGNEIQHLRLLNTLGWIHAELQNVKQSIAFNARSVDGARRRGDPETIANAQINLAENFLAGGDAEAAASLLTERALSSRTLPRSYCASLASCRLESTACPTDSGSGCSRQRHRRARALKIDGRRVRAQ